MESIASLIQAVHRKLQAEQSAADPPSRLFPPATPQQIQELQDTLDCKLPRSYLEFLAVSDGWSGFWFGLLLTGTASPTRAALLVELDEALQGPEGQDLLDWAVILGANADEDLFLLFDPQDDEPGPEPHMLIWSLGEGLLEEFDSFTHLLRTLAEGENLPRTVPLDLERQFRAWTEEESQLIPPVEPGNGNTPSA